VIRGRLSICRPGPVAVIKDGDRISDIEGAAG
jgi:hypothetical protein